MNESILRNKSLDFSLSIIKIYKILIEENREYVMSKQLLRAATSIGANLSEAVYGASKFDFRNKLFISLKEASETKCWLDLLYRSDYISEKTSKRLQNDCSEILRLLTSSINTCNKNLESKR